MCVASSELGRFEFGLPYWLFGQWKLDKAREIGSFNNSELKVRQTPNWPRKTAIFGLSPVLLGAIFPETGQEFRAVHFGLKKPPKRPFFGHSIPICGANVPIHPGSIWAGI